MPEADPEDARLARDCCDGSLRAFDQLVARHHEKVFGFLLTLTRHRQDAEDLTQDTFLKAWRFIKRYDTSRPLLPWLLTIARRQSIAMLRKRKPIPVADPDPEPITPPSFDSPALRLWALAERCLPHDAYTALWLHYRDELPLAEVGRILGKREGAVKVMLHRARKSLAEAAQNRPTPPRLPSTPPRVPTLYNAEPT